MKIEVVSLSLVRQLMTSPNLITCLRIVLIPFILLSTLSNSTQGMTLAFSLLLFATLSDALDGYVARKFGGVTDLGKILDPVADKLLIGAVVTEMVFVRQFPIWLAIVIVGRDLTILVLGSVIAARQRIVVQSNVTGKWTFAFLAALALSYFVEFPFGQNVFTWLSIIFIVLSSTAYLISFMALSDNSLGRKLSDPWPAMAGPFLRLGFVIILAPLVLVKLFFWIGSNEKVALDLRVLESPDNSLADSLVRKYAPVLYFAKNEYAFPIEVKGALENSDLRQDFGLLFGVGDRLLVEGPVTMEALMRHSFETAYLDLSTGLLMSHSEVVKTSQRKHRKVVYARVVKDSFNGKPYYIVQYWFYYLFSTIGSTDIKYHEGDWEMVSFFLDTELRPLYAAYSQHYYAEVKKWSEVTLEGTSPVVYVARGGHAAYFSEGAHDTFLDNEKVIRLGTDRTERGITWEYSKDYTVERIDDLTPWIAFKGNWGQPNPRGAAGPRYRNPRNPKLSMWSYPIQWMNYYFSLTDRKKVE